MAQARRDEIAPRSAELKNRGQQRRCASKDEKRETVGDSKQALLAANNEHKVVLFGFDLSHLPSNTQFFFCVGGVFTFNVLYGYLQELLAVTVAGRKFALFLAACQFAGYAFWSHVLARLNRSITRQHTKELALQRDTPKVPMNKFVGLSLLRAFDLAITNSAMQFLNYPAKTLIKSCRVVFTMFMGVLMLGKRYKPKDYVAVFTLVIGLGIFLHADSTTSAVFHPLGVLLLVSNCKRWWYEPTIMFSYSRIDQANIPIILLLLLKTVSLVCDGTLNNWSEQMMDQYSLSQDDFHSRLYGVSLLATVVAAFCSDELLQGIDMFLMQPGTIPEIESGATEFTWSVSDKAIALLAFSTSGIMGASCLGAITKRFGCLSMALTSTARKATTLFLSFALFHNN
jgi:drug/metabolite transporter (DMT)-like permease